ncbi:hypothetical protein C2S51_035189 [Perilla frutescens var. frutescens]|nr:hypothetical protein C2S51_035189 [Perilla frutescens var. frutescens]
MLDFLEDCVSQHQIFVENELRKSEEHFDGETAKCGSKSFLHFARDQFTNVASPLRSCMLTSVTHLPRSFIEEGNYQNIMQLFSFLDSLEIFLFEDSSMVSKDFEVIFLQQIRISSESFIDTASLQYIRSQCVFILKSLKASLSKLGFPVVTGKTSTTEFCFQKASLIFCTMSSSYKLHSIDTEPFQLLVIDEATQVKEYETTIAFQIKDVRHTIMVGDECQLPATVSNKVIIEF